MASEHCGPGEFLIILIKQEEKDPECRIFRMKL